ncbi:MAG TPA: glycosyltransferase [Burkholderiaceae bacterium]|jgi:glycosyltransferase involved in cell wall biosynthesis|nr:glycosyltransferase [Burkholderiaceae bacterium]
MAAGEVLPTLLVMTSTYPRWRGDPEPGFVHELSRRLTDRFQVVVLGPHAPGALPREVLDGVEVIRYRYAPEALETLVNDGGIVANLRGSPWKLLLVPGFLLSMAWSFFRLLRRRKIDVVHAHWLIPQGFIAAMLTLIGGRKPPFVVTSHGADLFAMRSWPLLSIKKFVARRASATTVVSEGMRDEVKALGLDVSGVAVEPMGVDLKERYRPDTSVSRSRSELLFVGRLVEKKGLRHLLDALPLIRSVRPDIQLTVAGFGPELDARRAQAKALGLMDIVAFVGAVSQDELPALYRRAALFVAPFVAAKSGDQDGLGLVLIEALGCGCPVVVSRLPATRALAASCAAVHEAEPGDALSLSESILRALEAEESPRLQDIAGFDWESRAAAYGTLLERAMGYT